MRTSVLSEGIKAALFVGIVLAAGCEGRRQEFLEVGNVVKRLDSTEELSSIKYRLVDYRKPNTELVKKNIDFMDYTLRAQKGGSIAEDVLVAFRSCRPPIQQVEEFHMVRCSMYGEGGGDFFLMGDDRAISAALHIKEGKTGVLVGGNVGAHQSLPIISVVGEYK